jgi:nucleotide-binding universal stress UspA family protein
VYKKILVPLDGSSRAEAILPHVEELAKCLRSQVILLCVFRPDISMVEGFGHNPEFYETIYTRCRDEYQTYLNTVEKKLLMKGLQVRSLVEEGEVTELILAVARREDVDLLAMSSHGRTGLARVIFGSVAASVLHKVDRPLLIIRSDREE